jgi:7-carboxy-7-deazaguanine synthase
VADLAGARLITLTGGEPFLQRGVDLEGLVDRLRHGGYSVEAFTNGTLPYPEWAVNDVSMIMDWKLPGSGEDHLNEIRHVNINNLWDSTNPERHAVKFVCKDYDDFQVALSLWSLYLQGGPLQVYYGKVWDGNITDAQLAEAVMGEKLPWKMNVQLHNYIWDPQERGR